MYFFYPVPPPHNGKVGSCILTSRQDDDPHEHGAGLVPQLGMMIRALLASPVRNTLVPAGRARSLLVIVATAYGQIRLNRWNQPFYDALARRDFRGFMMQLGVFAIIAGVLLILNVAQRWLAEMLKLKLREGLVRDLVGEWLKPASRLSGLPAKVGRSGVNPDQRMHEDARHLTELSSDLGVQLLQSSILLVTFVDMLWRISGSFVFHAEGRTFSIPGYMVWAAIIYAGSGSLLSYWVGRGLIRRNADRYQRESELRYLAQSRQRAYRPDRDGMATKRGRRPHRLRSQERADGHAQAGDRPDRTHLGHGRLWLADPGGADPGGGAGLFRRQPQLRRPDDGGGRLQSGAILAALVRGQFFHHRGLARHPVAGRRFPPRPDGGDAIAPERCPKPNPDADGTISPAALLQLEDDALLEAVARQTFRFFWEGAEPASLLARDRSTIKRRSAQRSGGGGRHAASA